MFYQNNIFSQTAFENNAHSNHRSNLIKSSSNKRIFIFLRGSLNELSSELSWKEDGSSLSPSSKLGHEAPSKMKPF